MAHLKAIPKKRSGRLLVSVRNHLLKQLKFECWLLVNYPEYFDDEYCYSIRRNLAKIEERIKRAVDKERLKQAKELQVTLIQ